MAASQGTPDTSVTADRPHGRRSRRSRRLRLALGLLLGASVLVVAAVVLREPLVLTGAAVLAMAAGWASYRLAGRELIETRRECAAERTGLAESYRDLSARRSAEATEQQQRLTHRLAEEGRTSARLRSAVSEAERRAGGSEQMLEDVRRRLGEAEQRYAAMESLERLESAEDELTVPVRVLERDEHPRLMPEWARLEADPVEALLAWETHAGRVTGSHAVEERKQA